MASTNAEHQLTPDLPDITISVRQTFGIDSEMQVPAFSNPSEHVPDIDDAYRFDHDTTLAILAGWAGAASAQVPPSAEDRAGYTGLFAAAARGDAAQTKGLLADGQKPDGRDAHGRTPLHVAAFGGHHEAMQVLAAAGADPNALERDRYEFDHAQVGAILAEDWGLSARQCDGIRAHHEPDRAERSGDLARLLNAADALAYAMGHGVGAAPPDDVSMAPLVVSAEDQASCIARARVAFGVQMQLLA